MAEFAELLELLVAGGDDVPETIYDDLRNSYNSVVEGSQATLSERDVAIAERDKLILELKARNHDLLLASPAYNKDNNETEEPSTESMPGEGGIDALFDEKKETE